MVSRRTFLSLVAGSMAASRLASAQQPAQKVALYANVGPELTHYDVDVAGAELIKRETVTLTGGIQYAWPHKSRRYLYVASSNAAPGYVREPQTDHFLTALAIDPKTGALTKHGDPIRLPQRPIHLSTDIPSENILVAFPNPSAVRVYRIHKDGTPGEEVKQPGPIEAGIYAHQIRTTPDNKLAILVTRGNEGTPAKPEDPGALKVFDYKDALLSNEVSIAPNGGKEFGPRHLDFHPTKPWMYVSIETQNKMYTYRMENGRINPEIAYRAETLAEPNNIRARQAAGTVHVHPNGRFLYGANRAEQTVDYQGKKVFKGGENSIVVYAIDQSTGEPTPIQHADTHKIHPRTFHIDPSGRLLVAQHNLPVDVRDGDTIKTLPAGLSVFRIADDGKLTFVRGYDIDVGDSTMFWMGMV
ncbi:MAG: beta-propeller fold lactonase family protein, partial [Alphaproteobacteria bacterium]|nr:beta-propeller fold lactonase family protein [Alphaproteobacteria bacterium]